MSGSIAISMNVSVPVAASYVVVAVSLYMSSVGCVAVCMTARLCLWLYL